MKDRNKFHRWVHLIHLTEEMCILIKHDHVSLDQMRTYLASVDEAFKDAEDPVAEFPSFALMRFCKELSRCLEIVQAKRSAETWSE